MGGIHEHAACGRERGESRPGELVGEELASVPKHENDDAHLLQERLACITPRRTRITHPLQTAEGDHQAKPDREEGGETNPATLFQEEAAKYRDKTDQNGEHARSDSEETASCPSVVAAPRDESRKRFLEHLLDLLLNRAESLR